jgi:outer membrane protein assembly factor BamA
MKYYLPVILVVWLCQTVNAQNKAEKFRLFVHVTKEGRKTKTDSYNLKDSSLYRSYIRDELYKLHSSGYLTANDSVAVSGNSINAYIWAGNRYKSGSDSIFDSGTFLGLTDNRKYYSLKKNQSECLEWIKAYENRGYPFVRIEADSLITDLHSISFRYQIYKGNYIVNDSVEIHGEKVLKQKFLIQYLQIYPGKPYSEKIYSQVIKNLNQLGFVSQSRPPDVWFGSDMARLNIYLKKKSANQFQGIVGIVPPSGNETKTTATGDVSLALTNTFGHADKMGINWKKYDRYGQQLDAEFVYPYLFYLPTGIDLRFKLLKKDSTYLTTEFRWGVPIYFQAGNHAGILYERKSSDILVENPGLFTSDFTRNAAGFYTKWNNYDRLLIPRKGAGLEIRALVGKKESVNRMTNELTAVSQSEFFEQSSYFSVSYPLSSLIGLKTDFSSGFISGPEILMNEMHRLGGYKSLKGFDEESIYVQNFASANAEVKIFIGEYSNVFAFYNQAYYRRFVPNDISDSPYGFGWGIELETPAGILSLVYALGKQFDNPIEIRNSKIHISLLNRF